MRNRLTRFRWKTNVKIEMVMKLSETKTTLDTVGKRKHVWLGHVLRHESLLHNIIKGRMRGKATRGRKRMHLLSDMMKGKYVALKRTAEDRKEWRKLKRAGSQTPASQQIRPA